MDDDFTKKSIHSQKSILIHLTIGKLFFRKDIRYITQPKAYSIILNNKEQHIPFLDIVLSDF